MHTPKIFYILTISLAVLTLPKEAPAEGGNQPESRMLMHLLKMEDAELVKLRQTVERIEAMSTEERANMRQRLSKLQEMDPERRKALKERYEAIPKEKREAMHQKWMSMSREERREFRQKLRNMSPEERADTMEEAGIMPPKGKPRHQDGQGPPDGRKGPPPPLD